MFHVVWGKIIGKILSYTTKDIVCTRKEVINPKQMGHP